MSRENVEAMRRAFEAWNRDDFDGWVESAHADGEFVSDIARRFEGSQKVYRGRDGMREYWDEWRTVWHLAVEVSEIQDHGHLVLTLAHVSGHGRTSGVTLDADVAYVATFDDAGGIMRVRSYMDPAEARAAVQAPGS
ncbi:MAG: nuclear transport factor 2 family protein [Thermoleophilaceae bacterium]